jgi:hypothetical protein
MRMSRRDDKSDYALRAVDVKAEAAQVGRATARSLDAYEHRATIDVGAATQILPVRDNPRDRDSVKGAIWTRLDG